MTKSEGSGQYSQDCSICLNSIAVRLPQTPFHICYRLLTHSLQPCQCLFVAPCSHTWHYKCIRALLSGPNYPIFICPNCRAAADLEAEVEDPEDWEQIGVELEGKENENTEESRSKEPRLDPPAQVEAGRTSVDRIRASLERARATRTSMERTRSQNNVNNLVPAHDEPAEAPQTAASENADMTDAHISDGGASTPSSLGANNETTTHATSDPVPIPTGTPITRRTPSPNSIPVINGHEGPITPRNDAGPWVFDGSGARIGIAPTAGARQSLNGVVDDHMDVEQ